MALSFKDAELREQYLAPSGYWLVLRPEIGSPSWVVRVLNFATWTHRRFEFPDEASARTEFDRWRL